MREADFCCYSDDEVRTFALDMRRLFIHDCARHLAICTRCQTRLKFWTKLLCEFDRKTFARYARAMPEHFYTAEGWFAPESCHDKH